MTGEPDKNPTEANRIHPPPGAGSPADGDFIGAPTEAVNPAEHRDRLLRMMAPPPPGAVPHIHGYRIIRVLASGGMGTVYEAEQQTPRRSIALKVIRAGHAGEGMLRRLEYEAHVLGLLHHPGIAQIYEAGSFDSGGGPQPFFAMELIEGLNLRHYAELRKLPARDRLELLIKICEAVHHAHQKGVIHRDLKPENILVGEDGQPKILDFGVARVTGSDLRTTNLRTQAGVILGTITYMSPEQATGDPEAVDARADIYTLGVIGYELLSGRLPLDLANVGLVEAARMVREEEPRHLSLIDRAFRGDLDTIIAKALDKDKTRRYQSAAELALDIRHYLRDEPIVARRPSTLYQLQKFARRNRALVAGVAAAFAVLIIGIITTAWQAAEATRERNEAREARELARQKAETAERVSGFLVDIFAQADPNAVQGRTITAREILDEGARRVATDLGSDPAIAARLMRMIGMAYEGINEPRKSADMHAQALALYRRIKGDRSPEVFNELVSLGMALGTAGRYDEGITRYHEALALAGELWGDRAPVTHSTLIGMAQILHAQAYVGGRPEKFPEAIRYHRLALDAIARDEGVATFNYARALGNYARTLHVQGRLDDEVEGLFLRSLETFAGLDGPGAAAERARAMTNLGYFYEKRRNLPAAERQYRDVIELTNRAPAGVPHMRATKALADFLFANGGSSAEAIGLYREFIRRHSDRYREPDMELSWALKSLGRAVSLNDGGLAEGIDLMTQATAIQRRLRPVDHKDPVDTSDYLIGMLIQAGQWDKAEPLARQWLLESAKLTGGAGEAHARHILMLSRVLFAKGDPAGAKTLREEAAAARLTPRTRPAAAGPAAAGPSAPDSIPAPEPAGTDEGTSPTLRMEPGAASALTPPA